MKKLFAILGIVLGVIILALILLPIFFKGDIIRIVEQQSAKYIKAELEIGDVGLSMFKSFPSLNVDIKEVVISGKDEFKGDTLVNIPLLSASVNLGSLISGKEIVVNRVLLKNARLATKVLPSGKANWDIFIDKSDGIEKDQQAEESEDKDAKDIKLNDITVENLYVEFNDQQSSLYTVVEDIDLKLSGNFSESNTLLDVLLDLNDITVRQGNIVWLSKMDVHWVSQITADFNNMKFGIAENALTLNDLKLDLNGTVQMLPEKYLLNLKLNAPDTRFETLLAMIPKAFQHYVKGIETSGEFALSANLDGEMYEGYLPAFDVVLKVSNAWMKYPDLPEAIEKVNLDFNMHNPGGSIDATVINLRHLGFTIAGNPFTASMSARELNDIVFNGSVNGIINFSSLKNAIPIPVTGLQGIANVDVAMNGKYRYIEEKKYERFNVKGHVILNDFFFTTEDLPGGVAIPQGSLTISTQQLILNNFTAKVNASDFTLSGNISNYLPYILKGDVLKGEFRLTSDMINLNEFLVDENDGKKEEEKSGAEAGGVFVVPANLDMQLTTSLKTILFDKLSITNVKGNVKVAKSVATLTGLNMNMLKGSMALSGLYNTQKPEVPFVDFNIKVSDFDINSAYNSFSIIRESVPIALNCEGLISAAMKFSTNLDKEMNPVMTTANANGFLESKGFVIKDNPTLNQLSTLLKNKDLNRIELDDLKINFKMENGNIIVDPFTTEVGNIPTTMYGTQSVDGKLDYTLSMKINRQYFGGDIEKVLGGIPGGDRVQNIDVDVKVGGTLDKPTVKPDLTKALNAVAKEAEKELKDKAKKEIKKGLDKLFK